MKDEKLERMIKDINKGNEEDPIVVKMDTDDQKCYVEVQRPYRFIRKYLEALIPLLNHVKEKGYYTNISR